MVKDRLNELRQAQGDDITNSDTAVGDTVLEFHDDDIIDEQFFPFVTEIQEDIARIQESIEDVRKKHSIMLSAPFPDERVRDELDSLMASIKKTANKVRGKLKGIEQQISEDDQQGNISTNLLVRKTQHAALSKRFVQVMTDYSITQSNYRDACKNRIRRQLEITGRETTDDEIEEMLEQGNVAIFTQGIIMETQQARQTLADIEARHADIIQLEKSIKELHDMFMEMALLVENQGDMIDSIEYNVLRAGECVNKGTKETAEAAVYQKKARRKKIFIIICLLVTVIVILAILLGTLL